MDKWSQISKDKIETTEFSSYDVAEPLLVKYSYRVTTEEMGRWENNDVELRKLVSELFFKYSKGTKKTYDHTTYKCDIPEDTMRKTLKGRCKITRQFLAKFTVGLKIDIETADKLFELLSGKLNPTNKFDYIVMCALKDGDDISTFVQDVEKNCGKNL